MSRLQTIDPSTTSGKAKTLLDGIRVKLGIVPNMTRVMANSPAVLEAYVGFNGALAGGRLDPKIREQLALVIAQENGCNYCLSAHTAIGKLIGLKEDQIIASRGGNGGTNKASTALIFAKQVLESKGHVSEIDIETVRAAGFSDEEISEIIAHVGLNIFTNYFNEATAVEIDFPSVSYDELK